MLETLSIRNIVLVEKLDIDFGEGSVSKNYFLDNRDDGIDFGAAGPLKVNNNFIKENKYDNITFTPVSNIQEIFKEVFI